MTEHDTSASASYTATATVIDTVSTELTVQRFVGSDRPTPGNVGICLSGGGSRALAPGWDSCGRWITSRSPMAGRPFSAR